MYGFTWQSCGNEGGFCETPGAAPMKTEHVPASYEMDSLLAKAEPISVSNMQISLHVIQFIRGMSQKLERRGEEDLEQPY